MKRPKFVHEQPADGVVTLHSGVDNRTVHYTAVDPDTVTVPRDALDALVGYCYAEERKDYEIEGRPEGHIFTEIQKLDDVLYPERSSCMSKISYDPDTELATVIGPGGFTQVRVSQISAHAIALALRVEFEVRPVIVRA